MSTLPQRGKSAQDPAEGSAYGHGKLREVTDEERIFRWSRWNVGRRLRHAEYDLNLDLEQIEEILGDRVALHNKHSRKAFKQALDTFRDENQPEPFLQDEVIWWSENNEGVCLYEAVEMFGLPYDELRKMLGSRAKSHLPGNLDTKREASKSKARMVFAFRETPSGLQVYTPVPEVPKRIPRVRELASTTPPLVRFILETGVFDQTLYDEWSEANDAPSLKTLIDKHGTWGAALITHGVHLAPADFDNYWLTDDYAYAALRDAIRNGEDFFGLEEYTQWSAKNATVPAWWEIISAVKKPWQEMVKESIAAVQTGNLKDGEVREISENRWFSLRLGHLRSWQELVRQFASHSRDNLSEEAFDAYYSTGFYPTAEQVLKQVSRRWNAVLWMSGIRTPEIDREYSIFGYLNSPGAASIQPTTFSDYDVYVEKTAFHQSEDQLILQVGRAGLLTEPETSFRNRSVIAQYCNGATLTEIGESFGFTRERARQIIILHSYADSNEINDALRSERDTIQDYVAGIETEILVAWSNDNFGTDLSGPCKAFGISKTTASKYLGNRAKFHRKRSRGPRSQTLTPEEVIELVKRFYSETGSNVGNDYRKWSKENGELGYQSVVKRFGTWKLVLRAAGLPETHEVIRNVLFTEEDCWAAILEYVQEPSSTLAFHDFDRWAQENPFRPSGGLIRDRIKQGWGEMIETSLNLASGDTQSYDSMWVQNVMRKRDWELLREKRTDSRSPVDIIKDAYSDLGMPLTNARYQEWAKENGAPVSATLTRQFGGGWNDLLRAAGIPLTPRQIKFD